MRSDYWDGWKGVAIIAVIAIHASGASGSFPPESFNWYFGLVLRQLINFAVPLFLAYAGYFASRNSSDLGPNYYRNRLNRILPPYLFWTVIFVLLRNPSHFLSPMELARDIFFGMGIGIGYFVVVLVQFVLLTPVLSKIKNDWQHIVIMCATFVVAMLVTYEVRINYTKSLFSEFPVNALPFFLWYPFYHLGFYVAKLKLARNEAFKGYAWIMLLVFLLATIASVAEGIYLARQGFYSFGVSQIKLTSFIASIFLFLFSVSHFDIGRSNSGNKIAPWLGRHSYPIYLMHLLFLSLAQKILKIYSAAYDSQPIFVFLSSVVTLAACAALIHLLKLSVPTAIQKKYIGI